MGTWFLIRGDFVPLRHLTFLTFFFDDRDRGMCVQDVLSKGQG